MGPYVGVCKYRHAFGCKLKCIFSYVTMLLIVISLARLLRMLQEWYSLFPLFLITSSDFSRHLEKPEGLVSWNGGSCSQRGREQLESGWSSY